MDYCFLSPQSTSSQLQWRIQKLENLKVSWTQRKDCCMIWFLHFMAAKLCFQLSHIICCHLMIKFSMCLLEEWMANQMSFISHQDYLLPSMVSIQFTIWMTWTWWWYVSEMSLYYGWNWECFHVMCSCYWPYRLGNDGGEILCHDNGGSLYWW